MSLKIFEINDCEWWAGDCSETEMLAFYMAETGCSHEDSTGDAEILPSVITDEALNSLTFTIDEDGNFLNPPLTFRQRLDQMVEQGYSFPCFFAATEY